MILLHAHRAALTAINVGSGLPPSVEGFRQECRWPHVLVTFHLAASAHGPAFTALTRRHVTTHHRQASGLEVAFCNRKCVFR
jgi:hypothetical protein